MHRPLTVRILGAGVSGLSSAIALATDGHEVELIDEHFAIPAVGTALGLFGPAQRVLERLGVLEEVRARSAAPRSGRLIGTDGSPLATIPAGAGSWWPARTWSRSSPRRFPRRCTAAFDASRTCARCVKVPTSWWGPTGFIRW